MMGLWSSMGTNPTQSETEEIEEYRIYRLCKLLGRTPDEILDGLTATQMLRFELFMSTEGYMQANG